MAYATITDLEERWRPLDDAEKAQASTLLRDAAVMIDAECPLADPYDEAALEARVIVSCGMVKRAMAIPGGLGVGSTQQGAGPYQETLNFTNPMGDLYLTKSDRRLLGCSRQVAFTVSMAGTSGVVHRPWCSLAFGASYCSCGADIAGAPIFEAIP